MPLLNVPHQVEQQPGWWLPACVAMVIVYWEQTLAQEGIARWLDTRQVGTPANRTMRLARRGFDVINTSGAPATFVEWLTQGVWWTHLSRFCWRIRTHHHTAPVSCRV
jgi:hypothetical protein